MFIMEPASRRRAPCAVRDNAYGKDPVVVLDAGANVDCRPYHLFQFGLMGDAFARIFSAMPLPRMWASLSIGEEEGKGNSQVKEAYELLKMAHNLNFYRQCRGAGHFYRQRGRCYFATALSAMSQ